MQVTFNPSYNVNQTKYSFKNNQKPSFKGAEKVAQEAAKKTGFYDGLSTWIGNHFTKHLVNSKLIGWLADKFKNSKNLYQHCLTMGSMITSGMYVYKTATNNNLDKDRRSTLAVNQGLTFLLSTAMAYSFDKVLNGLWENVIAKYAGHQINDEKFYDNFVKSNKEIKSANKILKSKGQKSDLKSLNTVSNALKENQLYKKMLPREKEVLKRRIGAMGILKTTLIFGFIYRYFVPVLVTKPTNALCEKYVQHKRNKKAEKAS